jgi:hypothetical protein
MTPEEMEKLGVPADLRGEALFKDVPDIPTLFKVARDNHVAARTSIRVPGPEAGDKDKSEFEAKLKAAAPHLIAIPKEDDKREAYLLEQIGVPKEAKEYEPPKEHGLPEATLERLRAEAKAEGLTKKQFERRVEREKAAFTQTENARKEALAGIKKEYGAAFEERLALAAAAAKKNGEDDSTVTAIMKGEAPVGTIKSYLNFAKALGSTPGDLGGSNHPGTGGALTVSEAQARVAEIYKNPAFMQKGHPEYKALQDKLLEYNRIIYPPEK